MHGPNHVGADELADKLFDWNKWEILGGLQLDIVLGGSLDHHVHEPKRGCQACFHVVVDSRAG